MIEWVIAILGSTLRLSTPLVFAALGGLFSERSGVINIALEGMLIAGAFGAAVATFEFHSPWAGLCVGGLCGVLMSTIYGFFVLRLRSDQIVAGTAINLLAAGVSPFISKILYGVTGSTPGIPIEERLVQAPMWIAGGALACTAWIFSKTVFGLRVSFAGEHPKALDSAGVSVEATRWLSLAVGGMLAGIGGASLSICLSSSFAREMSAGRGFMALAALILGKWRPIPTALACLFFGFTEALQIRLQGVVLWGEHPVPGQFVQMIPYGVTILVLAGFVGQSRPPRALGTFFQKS